MSEKPNENGKAKQCPEPRVLELLSRLETLGRELKFTEAQAVKKELDRVMEEADGVEKEFKEAEENAKNLAKLGIGYMDLKQIDSAKDCFKDAYHMVENQISLKNKLNSIM